ncbi:hypothetical protein M3231_05960 [Neobacillus mesonae]|nr:hypothetical protein [Neobacillus mesonae]
MKEISMHEALAFGIETKFDLMDNGERKFRLNCSIDGSSYCRTVASEEGAWQNSHFHKKGTELYVVQSGWIVYAEKKEEQCTIHLLREGESITFLPCIPHNIYMSPHSVIHTIKFGAASNHDWYSSPELDRFTQDLNPEELFPIKF